MIYFNPERGIQEFFPTFPPVIISPCSFLLGVRSLSNDDVDDNENGKKAIGLD